MPERPVRAFLSHVREEGGFVAQVGTRLGRARIVVDRGAFRPGDPFPQAIRSSLGESNLFVLFASAMSIKSTWVTFEMNEAEVRRLQGNMKRLLVITTDTPKTKDLLPAWLLAGLVEHASTPARAADVISQQIVALEVGVRPDTLFLGRDNDLAAISTRLIPPIGQPAPRVLLVHGLRGVGRRSFVRRALRDHLSLDGVPIMTLGPAESVDWLHLELLTRVQDFSNQEELQPVLESFAKLSEEERGATLARLLLQATGEGAAPLIVDEGQLMDDAGAFRSTVESMIRTLVTRSDRLALVIVTPRAPQAVPAVPIVVYGLGPVDQGATRLLLTQGLRLAGVEAEVDDVRKLAPWIGGYPPAALLAIDSVQRYGMAATLADEPALKDLTQRIFAPMLDKLGLNDADRAVLRLLAPFRELPVDVIAAHLRLPISDTAAAAKRLVDLSVCAGGEIGIALSQPLRFAVNQKLGEPTDAEFLEIARALRAAYWQPGSVDLVPLSIVEALAVALARAADPPEELQRLGAYELPSVLMQMALEAYDARKWERALYYAKRVLLRDVNREDAMTTAFKAHVRLEQWAEADELFSGISRRGLLRRFYLKGFLHWKRDELADAVAAFRQGIAAGDRALVVRHNLAYCLFLLDRPREAKAILEGMPVRASSRNRFFLDLLAQVLIRLRKFDAATEVVDALLRYGFEADYHHRFAHLRLAQGRPEDALDAANQAVESLPHRNEARALKAAVLIALDKAEDAQRELAAIVIRTPRDRDMQQEQMCRLALRRGDLRDAEARWRQLRDRDSTNARRLRVDIINERLGIERLNAAIRTELEQERAALASAMTDLKDLAVDSALDADVYTGRF